MPPGDENEIEDLRTALRRVMENPEPISAAEIERRLKVFEDIQRIRARKSPRTGPFPSAVEMLREDRER